MSSESEYRRHRSAELEQIRRGEKHTLDNLINVPGFIDMSTKPTNPKQAFGDAKTPTSTVPQPVMYEVGLAMLEGALKYGRHNYRVMGVRASTYYDAARRHIDAWWEGEDIDPDSGLPHVTKAIACLMVLRDAQMLDMQNDDRPPSHQPGWQQRMSAAVTELKSKYPEPKEPYTRENTPQVPES